MMTFREHILGSLMGCALGDAMGSVTENLTFHQIREKYPMGVRECLVPDQSAFAYGNNAGQVTDDFSQTYLLCKEIIHHHGKIERCCVEDMLIKWSNMPKYFNRFAGPTTRSAIKQLKIVKNIDSMPIKKEVVDYASQATNGSAMKISPAGLFHPCDIEGAIKDAAIIASVTHNNQLAISGACSVAACIAHAFDENATVYSMVQTALYGAKIGETMLNESTHIVGGASVVKRMKLAIQIALSAETREEGLQELYDVVGSGLHISEAVPCAIGIFLLCNGDPWETVCAAVNIGYDTDTVAAIVGSIVGAFAGSGWYPAEYEQLIKEENDMDINTLTNEIVLNISFDRK